MTKSAISSRILLIGGGHSHVQFLKFWSMNRVPGVEAVMVSNVVNTPYSGMLPSRLCGWYRDEDMHFNLHNLCAQAGITFLEDRVVGLDHAQRTAQLAEYPPVVYDVASINVGIEPVLPLGAAGNPRVIAVKPISLLLKTWQTLLEDMDGETDLPYLVVGGGAAGFEISVALALSACRAHRRIKIILIESGDEILRGHSAAVKRKAERVLARFGIEIRKSTSVKKVHVQMAQLANGDALEFERMIVTTGAAAPGWFANTDLKRNENGFLVTDRYLQVTDGLFAVGDCAHFGPRPLVKAGVFAVREGPILCHNLVNAVQGLKDLKPYRPQRRFLSLLVSGHQRALLSYGPLAMEGSAFWRWKNKIDVQFMSRFAPHGEMAAGSMADNSCGGCGGKAPAETVAGVVEKLRQDQSTRDLLPDRVEDVGYLGGAAVSVDGFRTFTSDDFLFGQVSVLHALNDLFASGATPEGVTVMVNLPSAAPKLRSNRLLHVMKGVMRVLSEHGIRLLNAHTSEGSELSVTVTAMGSAGRKWSKGGLRAGLSLILTKPLGTGALLQAEKRGLLLENEMRELQNSLLKSHGPWMAKTRFAIRSATDISGFGLAGHLLEMAGGENLAFRLSAKQIAPLGGFNRMHQAGVSAFMTAQNRNHFAASVQGGTDLIYDPQTNGPLVLAIEPAEVPGLIFELKEFGFDQAKNIGQVTATAQAPAIEIAP